ncbi:excinuclease ABC subunit UvrB [Candidatus Peregrinibacteria bacterium]|nr:excinuclease ABC subunit UvrB [Candidatus Peregrinibacteria bacterium]
MSQKFKLVSPFEPSGDQPKAIEKLIKGLHAGTKLQTLLGATGTGKTFTMANVIQEIQKPTLVLSHNKTLAAQLCNEFRQFFPENAVSYFVSYYDYYQPEAYIARTDTYIEKEATINEEIDKFRHAATYNLLTRKDVIIVASVSCIYGLGDVESYESLAITITVGDQVKRDKLLRKLTDIQYRRSSLEFKQGMFHVMGDMVEIFPPSADTVFRIDLFGDDVEAITEVDSFTGELINTLEEVTIFPAKHDVTTREKIEKAAQEIQKDLKLQVQELEKQGKSLEAHRLQTRTEYDIEMLLETGYCNGIENYTRYFSLRASGEPPATLLEYFPDDFLLIVDESHMTLPQVGAMHEGNLSRKRALVEYGFRLPSALDNRPLKFGEFEDFITQGVFISATPGKYEKAHCPTDEIVEQIIRPTGLLDPKILVLPSRKEFYDPKVHTIPKNKVSNQIDVLTEEMKKRISKNQRILVTTATKKSAEDLSKYFAEIGISAKYLHSDIETLERIEILKELREGKINVVVGINLLREGLDLPEVSLIAILDADKEGFLRSRDALIQTIGRAARNVDGTVLLFGDKMTQAMREAIDETDRRRSIQEAHNTKHGITPQTIQKDITSISRETAAVKEYDLKKVKESELPRLIEELELQMDIAVQNLEFEKAAELRDEIEAIKGMMKP